MLNMVVNLVTFLSQFTNLVFFFCSNTNNNWNVGQGAILIFGQMTGRRESNDRFVPVHKSGDIFLWWHKNNWIDYTDKNRAIHISVIILSYFESGSIFMVLNIFWLKKHLKLAVVIYITDNMAMLNNRLGIWWHFYSCRWSRGEQKRPVLPIRGVCNKYYDQSLTYSCFTCLQSNLSADLCRH